MTEEKKTLTRRDFLKTTGIIAGGTAIGGSTFLVGCTPAAAPAASAAPPAPPAPATPVPAPAPQVSAAPAETVPSWDNEVDILVLGGGCGGTFAGYVAGQAGVKTMVVEAGAELGGTALISGGAIHASSISVLEDVTTVLPTADPVISRAYIENWIPFRDTWLVGTGAPCEIAGTQVRFGSNITERRNFFQWFHTELEKMGVEILLNTRGIKLFADEKGTINGALLYANDGTEIRVGAKAVILANGGWTNDRNMRAAYWGPWADRCTSRSVPYNMGDGLRMAMEHGALTTNGFGFFYGHVEAWPPMVPEDPAAYEQFDKGLARDLLGYIQGFSARGLFINYEGKRFCNENGGADIGGRFCEAILRQTKGHCFLVLDSADIAEATDNINILKNNGLVYDEGATIEELADKLAARGVNRGAFLRTVREYRRTPIEELEPPKTGQAPTAMSNAPFIAMQITGSPSAPFGGVKINTKGQVIGQGERIIRGLYATACCAGGFFYNEYGGSLGASSVFGKVCAETAISLL